MNFKLQNGRCAACIMKRNAPGNAGLYAMNINEAEYY